ncbi:hypothetical protein ABL78_4723 [Leptomonas seymouri]|uniref:Uncharacterized protein n=1 Tax=Leptomonas seymouri TaxID=5684 RepID=A0A0N1HW56_LEPSE|nr:hypothetical protein ABL78_4723 [Leptomonas seymouri]|eukprot:KPI86210.1 hypothetical protein ABL78_4723 [Leptomonas seymouri]
MVPGACLRVSQTLASSVGIRRSMRSASCCPSLYLYGGGSCGALRAVATTDVRRRGLSFLFRDRFLSSSPPDADAALPTRSATPPGTGSVTLPEASYGFPHDGVVRGGAGFDETCPPKRGPGRSRTATVDSPSASGYVFPVGRALRYVQQGQRFCFQTEGQEEIQAWLARRDKQRGVDGRDGMDVAADTVSASSSSLCGIKEQERSRGEVSRFTKYHAHQVLVAFKRLRRHLKQQQSRSLDRYGGAPTQGRDPDKIVAPKARKKTSTEPSALNLSLHDVDRLAELLFAATVLLHLGGLYSVADTHVEPLIDLCFSVSVFFAQDAATTARLQRATKNRGAGVARNHTSGGGSSLVAGQGKASPTSSSNQTQNDEVHAAEEEPVSAPVWDGNMQVPHLLRHRYLHSLHWSVVHFAAAVQHWGLLEHTSPLQSICKMQCPYERLLQTHAALLCDATRMHVDHVLWRELILLKSGPRAPAVVATWFFGVDAHHYADVFQRPGAAVVARAPPRLQQRRLQLLPMLWLSLLSSQLAQFEEVSHRGSVPGLSPKTRHGKGDAQQKATVFGTSLQEANWGSARHAFTALLPLFAKDARFEATAWALLHRLFLPDVGGTTAKYDVGRISQTASLAETCALLARVEQGDAALELGSALPFDVSSTCSKAPVANPVPALDARQRSHVHLAHFLRRFLDASAVGVRRAEMTRRELEPEPADHVLSSPLQHSTRSVETRTRGRAPSIYCSATQSAIRRPVQLYRALLNIPLCTLFLPPAQQSKPSTQASLPPSVTAEGVRLVNTLLLRVLLQWRADSAQRPHLHKRSSNRYSVRLTGSESKEQEPEVLGPDGEEGEAEGQLMAAATQAEWGREVFYILQAAHHLHRLKRQAAATEWKEEGGVNRRRSSDEDGVALQVSLLVPTLQTAARALAEQLGKSLLPRRLALMVDDGYALCPTEQKLLKSLDEELRGVLLNQCVDGGESTGRDELPEPAAGALPWSYKAEISALLKSRSIEEVRGWKCIGGL